MASQTTIGRTKKGGDFIAKAARVLLVIVLLLSMSVSAFAAPNQPYRQSHAASYNERRPINVEINGYAADMADYLIDAWYSEITALDGGRVEVFGYTQCNRICDEVRVKLTLQQRIGSTWVDLISYTFYDYETIYAEGSKVIPVERGSYYRVKSYHYAEDGLLIDETGTTTAGIYVE